MRLKNSLLSKYLLLIFIAIMILPVMFPILTLLIYLPVDEGINNQYQNGTDLEILWHQEAKKLQGSSEEEMNRRLAELHHEYSKADMFWVDQNGNTKGKIPNDLSLPDHWSSNYTLDFMKKSYDSDPFTVVAFIGSDKAQGFMVMQVPRSAMKGSGEQVQEKYNYLMVIIMGAVLAAFIFVSWIFFYRIRKRLLRLQEAMTAPTESGLPNSLSVGKLDEIGKLEQSFNGMIDELQESRKREQEEENLRKRLIANLSHDLRTPLTTIRGHAYQLQKEPLSENGKQSLQLIDNKISFLAELIENLLSYSQLTSGRYPYHPEKIDIVRRIRTSIANWYPVFESADFEVEVEVPEEKVICDVDPQWIERILDNFFQNILRHAKSGKYIGVKLERKNNSFLLMIEDKGPGMGSPSLEKGTGIGLTIVSLMLKEMKLKWEIDSRETGTKIYIWFKEAD